MGTRRPLAAHRLLVEFDLVTAGDIDLESLGNTLLQLSQAGLMGMVSQVVRSELDGEPITPAAAASVNQVRPPPDPKIAVALRELEKAETVLRSLLDSAPPLRAVV